MWAAGSEALQAVGAVGGVFATAWAVRLLDDCLDQAEDQTSGRTNLAARLGAAALPYALLALAVGALLHAPLSLSLFAAAYSVGMIGDLGRLLPLRLRGWQEAGLVLFTFSVVLGPARVAWAVAALAAVQLLDDLDDMAEDQRAGAPNLAQRWGKGEACMAAIALLTGAALLYPVETVLVLGAGAAVEAAARQSALGVSRAWEL